MDNKKSNKKQKFGAEGLLSPTVAKGGGLAYSVASVVPTALFLFVSLILTAITGWGTHTKVGENSIPNDWYIYCSHLCSQAAFFLAALMAIRFARQPVKEFVVKQKCHWKYFVVALLLQIGLLSLSSLNDLFLRFLEKFGYVNTPTPLPSMDGFGIVWVVITVALLPAVCEEFLFRGVILDGLRSFGKVGAILLCGGLFSLFHQNPAQTIYQFCCGAAFALVAIKSGSILPTMLSHFINNATILLLTKFNATEFTLPVFITVLCVASVCLIGSLIYLIFLDKNQEPKSTAHPEKQEEMRTNKAERKNFALFSVLGVAVCVIGWVSMLLAGL